MRYFLIFLISVLWLNKADAQILNPSSDFKASDFIPPSPQASALIKAGAAGVSLATGAATVSIPFYTFSSNKYSLPISMSYTTNGVGVDVLSTSAGMGWTLVAGGVVTRTVLGLPDESRESFALNNFTGPNLDSTNSLDLLDYLELTDADRESDLFKFNVPGVSGSFYLDTALNPVLLSKDNFKINRIVVPGQTAIGGFEIIDDMGIRYYLTEMEDTRKYSTGGVDCKNKWGEDILTPIVTAWHLSKIKINSKDSITFSYVSSWEKYQSGINQRATKTVETTSVIGCFNNVTYSSYTPLAPLGEESFSQCLQWQENNLKHLTEIKFFDGSKAIFGYDTARIEVPSGKSLKTLNIQSASERTIRRYNFTMEVFVSNNTTGITTSLPISTRNSYRTFLSKITDVNLSDTSQSNSYQFYYNSPTGLPPRLSYSQDHWGYFNGEPNSYFLPELPEYELYKLFDGSDGYINKTRNRNPSAAHMFKGTLNKIVYPTGGYEEINYTAASEKRFGYVKNDTTANLTFQNGEDWGSNDWIYDTIYIPFPQVVSMNSSCTRNVVNPDFHGVCSYLIKPINPSKILGTGYSTNISNPTVERATYLDSGYYEISTKATWDSTLTIFDITYQNQLPTEIVVDNLLGGVTVASIKKYTQTGSLAGERQFEYTTPVDSFPSIRRIVDYTNYFSKSQEWVYNTCTWAQMGTGAQVPNIICCIPTLVSGKVVLNSSIIYPLGIMGASPYYFTSVKEFEIAPDGKKNGMTLHKYLFVDELGGYSLTPFVKYGEPVTGTPFNVCPDYLVGEHETVIYAAQGSAMELQQKTTNFYSSSLLTPVINHVVNKKFAPACFGEDNYFINGFDVSTYKLNGIHVRLDSTEVSTYSNNDSLKVLTRYFYENPSHNYVTKKSVKNSKDKLIEETSLYPVDLVSSYHNSTGVITKMIEENIVSPVIEGSVKVNGQQANKSITKFREFPSASKDFVVDSLIKFAAGTSPVANEYYSLYDDNSNVLSVLSSRAPRQTLIWGYKKSLPIAKISNSAYDDAAYSSFEPESAGNWNYSGSPLQDNPSLTGKYNYQLSSGAISKSGLQSSGTYLLSYWTKNSSPFSISGTVSGYPVSKDQTVNGWKFYEHKISGISSVTISGSGIIDELRLYPASAIMVSFTYEPLLGMTSQCDANNRITYYEYDGLNRLVLIKDQDQHIVKKICYNYAGQPEDCEVNTNPVWVVTDSTRCQPCPSNSNYTSGNREHQEKDINPYSGTHNSIRWVSAGADTSCAVVADWQNTATALRCKQVNGANNGDQEQEQKDMNPCSPTYNQTRWVAAGTNLTACPLPVIYAKIYVTDIYNDFEETTATITIKFFSNAACTTPVSVSNLNVNYKEVRTNCGGGGTTITNNYSINCNGTQTSLGTQTINWDDGLHCWDYTFSVTSGTGYQLGN